MCFSAGGKPACTPTLFWIKLDPSFRDVHPCVRKDLQLVSICIISGVPVTLPKGHVLIVVRVAVLISGAGGLKCRWNESQGSSSGETYTAKPLLFSSLHSHYLSSPLSFSFYFIIYSGSNNYLIPCWFCRFAHLQRMELCIILIIFLLSYFHMK